MSCAAVLPDAVRDKLSAMARQQRELAAVRGVGEWLLIASLAAGACLFADHRWNLSPAGRSVCLAVLAATWIVSGWFRLIQPVLRRRSWTELAAAVERQHPELSERLTTLVELQAERSPRGSPLMHELLARQTAKAVSEVDFTQALPARTALHRAAIGMAAVALLLLPFLAPGGRYGLSWNRLLNPWGNHDWGHRLAFHVIDGDRVVARGSDVALQAQLVGAAAEREPIDVRLHWTDASGQSQQRVMTWSAEEQLYSLTIPRVERDVRYRLTSRDAVSREYRLTAADKPRITEWEIDIQPPAYTGLPAQRSDAVVGELCAPERSRVRLTWTFADPVAAAVLRWPEAVDEESPPADDDSPPEIRSKDYPLELSADRRSATIESLATASGPFTVELTSDQGLQEILSHELAVIPDVPPEIAIRRDDVPSEVRPDDVLPIPLAASDDYGLTAIELHWQLASGGTGQRDIPAGEIAGAKFDETLSIDLSEWNLPGDQTITFRAKAVDNRPLPAPQEAWSEPWEVSVNSRIDSLEKRQLAEEQQSLEDQLDKVEQAVALQKQAVDTEHRDTARQAVRGEKPPENQEDLARLEKRQEELLEQLDELRQELDRRPFLKQLADEHLPKLDESLADAQRNLSEAAAAKTGRGQIEQLSQSLDDLSRAEDQLAKLKQQAKTLAALEQELAELKQQARQAEKIADRLDQRAANPPAGNDAEELNALRQETGELNEHLDDLLRRRPELLESARREELERMKRLAEAARRLSESQEQLAESVDPQMPAAEAGQAAQQQERLNRTAQRLTDAFQQLAERLSQQPLHQTEPGQAAAEAQRSAQSASESMQLAAQSLAEGNAAQAGAQAKAAQDQLSQAAEQAAQAAGAPQESSSQGRAIPGEPASRVAEAAAKLQQAKSNLAQSGSPSGTEPADANRPSNAPSTDQPPPLKQSAAQLRQAAQAMSAACDCLNPGGRPGSKSKKSPGKSGSPGEPGTEPKPASELAEAKQPSPGGEVTEPPEGFLPFGSGSDAVGSEFELLSETPRPAAASRNWGRLPKNLQTEIRQGAAKKPHPEYSRQIKRYFERIAQPADRSRP